MQLQYYMHQLLGQYIQHNMYQNLFECYLNFIVIFLRSMNRAHIMHPTFYKVALKEFWLLFED